MEKQITKTFNKDSSHIGTLKLGIMTDKILLDIKGSWYGRLTIIKFESGQWKVHKKIINNFETNFSISVKDTNKSTFKLLYDIKTTKDFPLVLTITSDDGKISA